MYYEESKSFTSVVYKSTVCTEKHYYQRSWLVCSFLAQSATEHARPLLPEQLSVCFYVWMSVCVCVLYPSRDVWSVLTGQIPWRRIPLGTNPLASRWRKPNPSSLAGASHIILLRAPVFWMLLAKLVPAGGAPQARVLEAVLFHMSIQLTIVYLINHAKEI